ncbi:MAG: ABC transporter permease subunit [Gammaproteobacteria bacterium]|nr:ABC transporter permease subunit [Gammaproteobacteria bacterium]MDE2251899.1 ABC transporter permease subunit [Gammaproteobacteria bacterium]
MSRATRPGALIAALLLALIVAAALVVPWLSPYDYATPAWTEIFRSPTVSGGHPFGTDSLGRDLLVRVMWGCRISLLVGIAASLLSVLIGVCWGALAGYAGGRLDGVLMRTVDVLYAIPFIPFVIVLEVAFGRNFLLVFVAIGAVSWLDIARIVRGQTLAIREQEYIEAARALGVRTTTMLRRHVLPNLVGLVAAYATLAIPGVILFEALLSFLGLGVHPPLASLGSLVAEGANEMQAHPYLLVLPAGFLAAIILCLNRLGDALRESLDPRGDGDGHD